MIEKEKSISKTIIREQERLLGWDATFVFMNTKKRPRKDLLARSSLALSKTESSDPISWRLAQLNVTNLP